MTGTIREICQKLGMSYNDAVGFMSYLRTTGQASIVGKLPASSKDGRGAPVYVFLVPRHITLNFAG